MPSSCIHRAAILLFLLFSLSFLSARSHADQTVYDDSLRNGWENWSWCTVDFNAANYVHAGSRSVRVTYTSGWQGFYLHHAAFDSSSYATLTFWIHGGGVNGRNISVAGIRSNNGQPSVPLNAYIEGGSVSGSQWRKVAIPLSALAIANQSDVTGFWLQDASGNSQPAFYVDDIALVSNPAPSVVHVAVHAAQAIRTVDEKIFGVNAAIWDDQFERPITRTYLNEIDNRALRFPGGSLSNGYHWATNTTDNNTWQWVTSFDDFAAVAQDTNAQVFISVNYGSGTPQEAAAWVRYSNVTKGYGFKYWEIGNENYGEWERDDNNRPHDPVTYATRSAAYISQMKAEDPTIKIGLVAVTGEDSYANYTDQTVTNPRTGQPHNGWTPVMLTRLRNLGVTPDFLVYHRYAQNPGGESDFFLLSSSSTWTDDAANLRQMLTDYLGPAGANVELICTENNSCSFNPGKQMCSLVNGLFYCDSIANILKTEFNALIWWDMRNGQLTGNNNSPSLYGWRMYGDYGIVAPSNDKYPTFYAMKLMQHFARGGDTVVTATSDYALLSAYATKRADGSLTLLVINKSPADTLNTEFQLTNYLPAANGTIYFYGIPQDEAARTGTGSPDVATFALSGAGATFTASFAPYSATVLRLAPLLVSVSGTVTLEDCADSAQRVIFTFRPTDGGPAFDRTQTLNVSGGFAIADVPAGNYDLAVKGAKWLREVTPLNASSAISGLAIALLAGDANDDNSVDVLDLDLLIQDFDECSGGATDFNCDGCTDVLDLDLLIRNFDRTGDP